MLGLILQKKNQVCEQCFDGQNAIELVIEQGIDHFDLIFMDSIMPRMVSQ